jgi:hypothetical protein
LAAGTLAAQAIAMTACKRFLSLSLSALFVVAGCDTAPSCGSHPLPATPVAELGDAEARSLCGEFFVGACGTILDADDVTCTTCQPCAQAASVATIRAKCGAGITYAAVKQCIASGFDMSTCTGPERGGCMFDVADALCPTPPAP